MPWCVVMTKPNCELIAQENLVQQGYGCYFPRYRTLHKEKVIVKRPLFPRYIFAHFVDTWYSIRGTRGVSYILQDETGPSILPDRVIDVLKAQEDAEGLIVLGKPAPSDRFARGEKVRATEGPLMGLDLIYEGTAANDRVRVLTSLLGREVPVTIDNRSLIQVG